MDHLLAISTSVLFAVIFMASLYLLVLLAKKRPIAYYFFIAGYAVLTLSEISSYILLERLFIQFPHFFRVVSPFQYLVGPLGYFFVLKTLYPETKFKPIYLLHAIPFLLHFVELIPFYLSTRPEKIAFISNLMQHAPRSWDALDGLFFTYRQHLLLKFFAAMSYQIVQWQLIRSYKEQASVVIIQKNKHLIQWISFDNGLKLMVSVLVLFSIPIAFQKPIYTALPALVVAIDLCLSIVYVLVKPTILLGLRPASVHFAQVNDKIVDRLGEKATEMPVQPRTVLSAKQKKVFKTIFTSLEVYMQSEQPYLSEDFNRVDLASKFKLSPRKLSDIILNETSLSFSDYINNHRVNYIQVSIQTNPKWRKLSVESIALQSGFKNRVTLNLAIKRLKNQTPAQFFKSCY